MRESSFQLIDASRLSTRSWGAHAIVYDIRSGETHLFEDTAAEVVKLLRDGPRTQTELLERLDMESDLPLEKPELYLRHLLAELGRRQLLEQCS